MPVPRHVSPERAALTATMPRRFDSRATQNFSSALQRAKDDPAADAGIASERSTISAIVYSSERVDGAVEQSLPDVQAADAPPRSPAVEASSPGRLGIHDPSKQDPSELAAGSQGKPSRELLGELLRELTRWIAVFKDQGTERWSISFQLASTIVAGTEACMIYLPDSGLAINFKAPNAFILGLLQGNVSDLESALRLHVAYKTRIFASLR